MQKDFHYYGAYTLARCAGFSRENAGIVATASQYVDDCATKNSIEFDDAGRIDSEATAHHTADISNIAPDDQRQVWVPFHFLPGNEGDSFTERLVCRKDSSIARDMVSMALTQMNTEVALYRLGVTAHVYADTFSHYGFSGVSSRKNKIINSSIELFEVGDNIKAKLEENSSSFFEKFSDTLSLKNIMSSAAEGLSGALGHGAALTHPDEPFLTWSFEYEEPEYFSGVRRNQETFMEACEALYRMFQDALAHKPEFDQGDAIPFEEIRPVLAEIIAYEGDDEERAEQWVKAWGQGRFLAGETSTPEYMGEAWSAEEKAMEESGDSRTALESPLYKYYRAASAHRQYVLRELLPSYGLVVA